MDLSLFYKNFKCNNNSSSNKLCCRNGRINAHSSCVSSSSVNNYYSGRNNKYNSASKQKNRKGIFTRSSEQKENQSVMANCNLIKKGRNFIPTPSKNLSQSGMKKVNGIGISSPYMMLKQNLGEKFTSLEIDDSIRNLGNLFARTEANENLIERFISKNNIKKSGSSSCFKNNSNNNSYKTSDSKTNKEKGNIIETPTKVFDINNYIIKKQIGEGSIGKIYLVESTLHNKYHATKKTVATTSQELQTLKHEYEILLSLQQPSNPNPKLNLVKIHGITN